ncbi:uncharacterized protein LOC107627396 [Arachis ipaensis]|uniref:uncharacterized protein LOC107627396 n=1 Tax=Arachis ipaensis TaxID=130454 RepID=UPI0007AF3171|nr:uncharacterized protein LOC107627396 [Arachis ipaensis]
MNRSVFLKVRSSIQHKTVSFCLKKKQTREDPPNAPNPFSLLAHSHQSHSPKWHKIPNFKGGSFGEQRKNERSPCHSTAAAEEGGGGAVSEDDVHGFFSLLQCLSLSVSAAATLLLLTVSVLVVKLASVLAVVGRLFLIVKNASVSEPSLSLCAKWELTRAAVDSSPSSAMMHCFTTLFMEIRNLLHVSVNGIQW